jgi:hypothetical protein
VRRALVAAGLLAGCAAAGGGAWQAELERDVAAGRARVESYFGAPYPRPFRLTVAPDRAALDAHWRELFKDSKLKTECWMVGAGFADELSLLSPTAWPHDACEHDPRDHGAVARLVMHELVHTYHQQVNARLEDDAVAEGVSWFVEGLATFLSGQLEDGHLASAAQAIAAREEPARLVDAWKGKYKYGVSGSLVAFIEHEWGKPMVVRLIAAGSQEEILRALGISEEDLLQRWKRWVANN